MNEQIKLLADESGVSYLSSVHPSMLEKFAELIVRECINTAVTTEIEGNNNAMLRGEIATRLTKHFGVE
jgi:hypothetical protein